MMRQDFTRYILSAARTDLRHVIDGLATIVKHHFDLDPFQKNTLFLFCGTRRDRLKGLVWEGDGFMLLYKRIESGGFRWPRTSEEAMEISEEQYRLLMNDFEIIAKHPIKEVIPKSLL